MLSPANHHGLTENKKKTTQNNKLYKNTHKPC